MEFRVSMASQTIWVDSPDRWDRLAEGILRSGEAGYDSETYNQPDKTSPQYRTKLHCWSIAFLTSAVTARGYRLAKGFALPRRALDYPPLYDALRSVTLWAHNSPHDEHTARNEGLDLTLQDTLQWGRVTCPGMQSYGLKSKGTLLGVEMWALGKQTRDKFKEIVSYVEVQKVTRQRMVKRCACGRQPCRARQDTEWFDAIEGWKAHTRQMILQPVEEDKEVKLTWDVSQFNPGHPRWDLWLDYVVADAVSAIEFVDWLRNRPVDKKEYPWKR